ncbi:YdeI/OmpD-associated family protein [Neobacillus mesonae]|nr:YdeI/OmpD-associated family protein [Neobacillus mesonae]
MTKTIVEKLSLHKYSKKAVLDMPEGTEYFADLGDFDQELTEKKYDLIFAFVLDMEAMKSQVYKMIEEDLLEEGGYLFLAYPKKGNKAYSTYIHRDEIMDGLGTDEDGYVGTSSIKFARMVGMDEVFTVVGLKKELRKAKKTSKASQRVDDYVALIPNIEQDLKDEPDLLAFYHTLTPGYQKDWARYVYSAKQEATKEKRREEMKLILGKGYKSRELYRQDQG